MEPLNPAAALFLFGGDDRAAVRAAACAARDFLQRDAGRWLDLLDPNPAAADYAETLAIVADDAEALAARLDRAIDQLADERRQSIRDAAGAYYESQPQGRAGATAVLFPGEGAPYVGMVGDLMPFFPELEEIRVLADDLSNQAGLASPTSRYLHAPDDEAERARMAEELKALDATMCSVLAADWMLHRILEVLGVSVQAVGGHSAGEIAALTAAGSISDAAGVAPITAALRNLAEADVGGTAAALLALAADPSTAQEFIDACGAGGLEAEPGRRAFVAMRNCPHQTIVVGDSEAIDAVAAEAKRRGKMFERLALGRPYHTPLFESYAGPLQASFADLAFHTMHSPVYSCTTGRPFPAEPAEIRRLALAHWSSPVAFTEMIDSMYADGVRVFIEAGPRGNLSSFVQDILRGRDYAALAMNSHVRDGWTHLLHFAAQLAAHRVPFFAQRLMPGLPNEAPAPDETATPENASAPPADQVMANYFQVMEQFLETQQNVMDDYLRACGAEGGSPGLSGSPVARPESFALPNAIEPLLQIESPVAEPVQAPAPPRPLVGEIIECDPGERIVMRRNFDLAEDLYAAEHTVGGRSISRIDPDQHGLPVAPMTFSLEMMAETAEALFPHKVVAGMKDVCLYRWLAFGDEPLQVEVRGDVKKRSVGELGEVIEIALEIRELGPKAQGPGDGVTSKGVVLVADRRPTPPAPPEALPDGRPCTLPINTLYNNLFHGPMFVGVESLDWISDAGVQATCRTGDVSGVFASDPTPNFIINPILLDVVLHPMAGWHLEQPDQAGRILLPYEVGKMELYDDSPAIGSAVSVTGTMESGTHRRFSHSAFAHTAGAPWLQMTGLKCWRFYLPFGDVNFHGPKDVYFLADEWPAASIDEGESSVCCVKLEPPEDLSQTALQDAGAQVMLSPREMETYQAMADRPKRRFEWLFGRAAAKDAVRMLWRRMTGERLFMADVEILKDEHGRPQAVSRDDGDSREFPSVAISHTTGLIVAAASESPCVGIDVERVATREAGFEQLAFDDDERALLDAAPGDRHAWVARFWCAKEAASKAIGLGLPEGPRGVAVRNLNPTTGVVGVEFSGSLAAAAPQFTEQLMEVRTLLEGDLAVAVTGGAVAAGAESGAR